LSWENLLGKVNPIKEFYFSRKINDGAKIILFEFTDNKLSRLREYG